MQVQHCFQSNQFTYIAVLQVEIIEEQEVAKEQQVNAPQVPKK